MSGPSSTMIHGSTGVNVTGSELINAGGSTIVNKINNTLIEFPDITGFFQFVANNLTVLWNRSADGEEPKAVEISDIVLPDPSSLPPVSSIADIYTRSMLECLAGYPLYNPEPYSELSMEYPRNGINVGDVGFVRSNGDFDFLFNICPPQNQSINPPYLPDGFSLETSDHAITRAPKPLPRNWCRFSPTVKITESDEYSEYTCEGSEGAVLELPEGAIRNEAIKIKPFEDIARLRGVQWYEYAISRGRNISNGALYLVTSSIKCTQWGIAVFDRPCHPGQVLKFVRSPLGWEGSRAFITDTKQGDTPNQCVFLQGYKIKLRQDIFDNLYNGQPPQSDPAMPSSSLQAGSSRLSVTRQPAQRIRGGGGNDLLSRILPVGKPSTRTTMTTVQKSDEVVLHADFGSSPFHPSDLINSALLNQNPDAKVALTHDDVWCDLLRDNFPTLNYVTLINVAQSYTSRVDEYGCVSLERTSDSRRMLDESSRPVRETETSVLQEPIKGAEDERNPDILPARASNTSGEGSSRKLDHSSREARKKVFPVDIFQKDNSISVLPDIIGFIHRAAHSVVEWTRLSDKKPDQVVISDIVPLNPYLLPVDSIAHRYTRSMLECMYGYPLYSPQPFSELSMEYPRNGVNIGDVGFVRLNGMFDFLFNICSPQKDLINPPNLPDCFSLGTLEHSTTSRLPPDTRLFTQTITMTDGEYICNGYEGAVLVLPEGAIQREATNTKPFEDLAKLHGVHWYKYAMDRGRSISNGSLYLVTSSTKCTQWGIAVFVRPCNPGQGLTFVPSPLGWNGSGAFITKVSEPNQWNTPNQCVSIRGYKITIRQDIFDSLRAIRRPVSRIRGG